MGTGRVPLGTVGLQAKCVREAGRVGESQSQSHERRRDEQTGRCGEDAYLPHVNVQPGSEERGHVHKHDGVGPGESKAAEGNGPDWKGLEHGLDGHRLPARADLERIRLSLTHQREPEPAPRGPDPGVRAPASHLHDRGRDELLLAEADARVLLRVVVEQDEPEQAEGAATSAC